MSNIVKDIRDALVEQIQTELPSYAQSPFIWDFASNNDKKSKNIFAVRPQSGSSVSGTNKTITLDQDFEVYLSTKYINKGDKDSALDEAIMGLFEDHEKLEKLLFRRNINIARVLVVESVALSAPEIDNENHNVAIIATYTIKYRNETA